MVAICRFVLLSTILQVIIHQRCLQSRSFSNVDPGSAGLTVFDSHLGSATLQRTITLEIEISLNIPNAFTPNGDRQNDTWHIDLVNADKIDEARIKIYDKRGTLLYEATGFENEWDGSANGQTLPADTYYYTIDLNLSYMKKTYSGAVSILH